MGPLRIGVCVLCLPLMTGCVSRHLARTIGQGRGEVRATLGGPFLGSAGAPILIPSLRVGGRYGATDWLDVDGTLALDPLVFGVVNLDAGLVGQIYRERDGFALSASSHAHVWIDLDDNATFRAFPELGLHADGPVLPWLFLFGGVSGIGSPDPPEGRPGAFIAPYVGVEAVIEAAPPIRHYLSLQLAWVSPWQELEGFTAWEPVGFGALILVAGWRTLIGPSGEPPLR